ncbi:MAG: SPOR domain-containing protein [Phenylobacterium sp.]|uniref:cell division protein FtsN n=1 Tax=Phenylobacterium sp. TaxID=1871053 RepID=UPI00391BB46E
MSDSDRGAYTPPTADAPLAFDARQPVRGSRPVPMTLIVSGVVLLILIAAIVFFYRSGVRQEGEAPQAVGAPVGEMKAPAPAGEQPTDPAASLQIYQDEAPAAGQPTFTPPPEEPAPRAAPSTQVAQAPAPLPPAQPASKAAELKPAQPAPAPKAAAPAPKTPAPAAAAPKPAVVSGGAAGVQIGAFSSKALADAGWNDAARIAPGAIAGKGKTVEPVQVNGSTLYRTTVTGFGSKAEAKAFCDALKAAGKNCFVK